MNPRLYEIQTKVHVSKDKTNEFGGYNYRTAEGILAAIKSALVEGETVVASDTLQEVAGQIFITATATICFADGTTAEAQGHALHPLTKKGMDPSQITGSASSYARKYALSGLAALDDGSADPDAGKEPYQPDQTEEVARLTFLIERAQDGVALTAIKKNESAALNGLSDASFSLVKDAFTKAKARIDAPQEEVA